MENAREVCTPLARSIPTELLSEIFLHCSDGGMDALNTISIPLLVSNICTRWREAAIATPRLWSRIFLHISYAEGAPEAHSALVNTWLVRSGSYPLTVYIFWNDPPFHKYHPVLEALALHSRRWKIMFFYMPFTAFDYLARIRGKLPQLTDLSLGTGDDNDPDIGTLEMFEIAPSLRSLECVNCSPFLFKFPWAQLNEIPVMAVSTEDCLDILSKSTQLETAGFIILFPGIRMHPPVIHKKLRHLTLNTPPWNPTVDCSQLFSRVTLPNLEELTVCNLQSPFGFEFTPFVSKMQSLKILHIRKTVMSDTELIRGLAAVPSLESLILHPSNPLEIICPIITEHLMTALTWKCRNAEGYLIPSLVPNLQKLELHVDAKIVSSFIAMAQSRQSTGDPDAAAAGITGLQHIRIRTADDVTSPQVGLIEALTEQGLSVDIEQN